VKRHLLGVAVGTTAFILVLSPPFSSLAWADDCALGRLGETVYPVRNSSVRMEAEDVHLQLSVDGTLHCRAVFQFVNESAEPQTILMGFPGEAEQREDAPGGHPRLHDFRTWVDGEEVGVKEERGLQPAGDRAASSSSWYTFTPSSWYTFTVEFAPGESRCITNTYWARSTGWSNGEMMAGYVLTTGALWAGTIGRATIRLSLQEPLHPYHILSYRPASAHFEGNELVWQFCDFEPSRDIEVYMAPEREMRPLYNLTGQSELYDLMEAADQGRRADVLAVLEDVQAHREDWQGRGPDDSLLYLQALSFSRLGCHEEAAPLWMKMLQEHGSFQQTLHHPNFCVSSVAPYYWLTQSTEGDERAQRALLYYQQLTENQLSPVVRRWLEQFVPEERRVNRAPAITDARVDRDEFSRRTSVIMLISDPDGDLDNLTAEAWVERDGQRVPLEWDYEEDIRHLFRWRWFEREISLPLGWRDEGTWKSLLLDNPQFFWRVEVTDGSGHRAVVGPEFHSSEPVHDQVPGADQPLPPEHGSEPAKGPISSQAVPVVALSLFVLLLSAGGLLAARRRLRRARHLNRD